MLGPGHPLPRALPPSLAALSQGRRTSGCCASRFPPSRPCRGQRQRLQVACPSPAPRWGPGLLLSSPSAFPPQGLSSRSALPPQRPRGSCLLPSRPEASGALATPSFVSSQPRRQRASIFHFLLPVLHQKAGSAGQGFCLAHCRSPWHLNMVSGMQQALTGLWGKEINFLFFKL